MTDLKFIKTFGLVLIGIGLILSVSTAFYITNNPDIILEGTNRYYTGLITGIAIGFALTGTILRICLSSK